MKELIKGTITETGLPCIIERDGAVIAEFTPYAKADHVDLLLRALETREALRLLVRAVEERNDVAMTMHAGHAVTLTGKAA